MISLKEDNLSFDMEKFRKKSFLSLTGQSMFLSSLTTLKSTSKIYTEDVGWDFIAL